MTQHLDKARRCLAAVKPDMDMTAIDESTGLLANRIITSLDVLDLMLHIERLSGVKIRREQLVPGSFRNLRAIADTFFTGARHE